MNETIGRAIRVFSLVFLYYTYMSSLFWWQTKEDGANECCLRNETINRSIVDDDGARVSRGL